MPKTLNDIIPPSRRREVTEHADGPSSRPVRPQHPLQVPRRRMPWGTIFVALLVVGLSAAILFIFSRAEVTVSKKSTTVTVDAVLSATPSGGSLTYEVVFVERVLGEALPAEGTETVEVPAQGTITIYNEQTAAQTLIKNTRFESPEGLIYRIRESVTVPAAKGGTPGSITATVYADEAGPKYNIGATKFTVPGLKGGASYSLVYARSTGDMTGGFSGTRPTVSKAAADAKRQEVRGLLSAELNEALVAEVPEGYVLLSGATRTAYESLPDVATAGSVEVREKGVVRAVVFKQGELAAAVAEKMVGQYQGEPISFKDTKDLTMMFGTDDKPWDPAYTMLSFSITGQTTLVWDIITEKIASAVAGKTREAAQVILTGGGFPEVGGARLVLRPFWRSTFPLDTSSIKVVVEEK